MKIFIGGKIREGYFRKGLVEGNVRYHYDDNGTELKDFDAIKKLLEINGTIVLKNAIFDKYDYTGAFFIGSGDNKKAKNLGKKENKDQNKKIAGSKRLVANIALQNVSNCDMFFAWLDTEDAFGTIVEIGYAKALGKPIYLAGYEKFREMWFVYKMADEFVYHDEPKEALRLSIEDYEKKYQ